MPAEARVTSIWKTQRICAAIFLIGFGGYFFFDGKVGYPRSNERWLAHEELAKAGREAEWPAFAASHGWNDKVPEKFHKPEDIAMQFVCGTLSCALGLAVMAYWFSQKGRVIKTDGEAVYAPGGPRVPFDAIVGLGKKNWDKKGLAIVRYEVEGRKGEFTLDDYKYEQEPTHVIMQEIEDKLLAQSPEGEEGSEAPASEDPAG